MFNDVLLIRSSLVDVLCLIDFYGMQIDNLIIPGYEHKFHILLTSTAYFNVLHYWRFPSGDQLSKRNDKTNILFWVYL